MKNDLYISIREACSELSAGALLLALLLSCLIYIFYLLLKSYLEYQVAFSSRFAQFHGFNEKQADTAYGTSHGCLPPPQLPNNLPLGIDWMRKLFHYDSEQRLLAFLCSIADRYEPHNTLSQFLIVGPRNYHVLEPKNLEAVQTTNFQGKLAFIVEDVVFESPCVPKFAFCSFNIEIKEEMWLSITSIWVDVHTPALECWCGIFSLFSWPLQL